MINVGITGGGSPSAGELIRILINHPDVMLRQICEPDLAGRDITAVHHGLIGECSLKFSDRLDTSKLDLLFVASDKDTFTENIPMATDSQELRIIYLNTDFTKARSKDPLLVYGVPEVNRKALVRGATCAVIPSAVEVLACIAFYPLALRSMLPKTLTIDVSACNDINISANFKPAHVSEVFSLAGNEPAPELHINYAEGESGRVIRLSACIDLPVPIDNIVDLYEEIYDDHNLTHIVGEPVAAKEVEGTDKCIVSLDKTTDGQLLVQAVADGKMRGGAGDAVHVMNLLMGLYEKTGLTLKASIF